MHPFHSFSYLDHRPEDFGITAGERKIGFAAKDKIIVRPPHSNLDIDFSEIYGSQIYQNRQVSYVLNAISRSDWSPEALQTLVTRLVDWLYTSHGKHPLVDDTLPQYYFMAEPTEAPSLDDFWQTGKLHVTFDCYPFKIQTLEEGSDDWDTFNFDDDIAQEVGFDVHGSLSIDLYDVSVSSQVPTIICSVPMRLALGGISYQLHQGENTNPLILFNPGINQLTVYGEGHIAFSWHKEVL